MPSRSIMIYGQSGSTKTSQVYHLVKWILSKPENKGKRFRMIHSDGGGYKPFIDSGMVARGEVEVVDYSGRVQALSDFRKLFQGYWPLYNVRPKGGEVIPEYFKKDSNCLTTPEQYKMIAGYIIEGMTSTGEVLKSHCSDQEEGVGWKESIHFEEDGEHISGLAQGHYDLIQKEIHKGHTKGFKTLPVEWLIYTALLGKGEDKQKRETAYGPQVVGNALTPRVPSWFCDCFHLDSASWEDKQGKHTNEMVAWFIKHPDMESQVPYLAKTSVLPEVYPELFKYFPYGFVPLGYTQGLSKYFKVEEVILKKWFERGEVKE